MSSQNTTNPSSFPPEEQSQYQVLKEGGFDSFQHFMQSHGVKMHDDDDVQHAKEILSRYEEYDRTSTHNRPSENDNPSSINQTYGSDSDSGSSRGVPIGFIEVVEDDEDDSDEESGCPVDGPYDSHFEWGVDEPEFEGYPVFSDEEDGCNSDREDYYHGPDDDDDMDYADDREGW